MASNPIITPPDSPVVVRLPLMSSTLSKYEAQSTKRPLEDVMAERLIRCADYSDTKPLYFGDKDRAKLESLLGKNFSSAKDALQLLQRSLSVRVNNVQITLKPTLLARLKSRCFTQDFSAWISKLIVEELERYSGMR